MPSPDVPLLENRNLLRLMAFRVQIVLAYQIVALIVGWHIYELTHNALSLGRVSSINGIFIGSSNELGAFESGVAARMLGLVPSVIFGGTLTLARGRMYRISGSHPAHTRHAEAALENILC